jgi:outer membrane protein assembly factor BamD (BamD/ComL family)
MSFRPLVLVASIATAPIQCGHETDPALRQDESPGDALWDLAQQFHEAHDQAAHDKTLAYLVQRYPASRWAAAARAELGPAASMPAADAGP